MKNADILAAIRDATMREMTPTHIKNLRLTGTLSLDHFEPGLAVSTWAPTEDFSIPGPGGFIFGGYVAAVTDSVAHFCMMTILEDGQFYSTADLRVSYFRPFTERRYTIEARIVTRTKTQAHLEVTFANAAGAMAAKATLVQRLRDGAAPPAARP